MASFGDMKTRIADELDRSDLTSQIAKAIQSAIAHYERRHFYFNESSFTFSTVAGQETYTSAAAAAIGTAAEIQRLNGSFYSTRTPLFKRAWEDLDDVSGQTTSYAQPEDWAYRAYAIRLYPIPDRSYVITGYHVARYSALSADGDSNVWTNEAEELIRTRAKIDLMANVIRGPEMAEEIMFLRAQERDALTALTMEATSRQATGFIKPTVF